MGGAPVGGAPMGGNSIQQRGSKSAATANQGPWFSGTAHQPQEQQTQRQQEETNNAAWFTGQPQVYSEYRGPASDESRAQQQYQTSDVSDPAADHQLVAGEPLENHISTPAVSSNVGPWTNITHWQQQNADQPDMSQIPDSSDTMNQKPWFTGDVQQSSEPISASSERDGYQSTQVSSDSPLVSLWERRRQGIGANEDSFTGQHQPEQEMHKQPVQEMHKQPVQEMHKQPVQEMHKRGVVGSWAGDEQEYVNSAVCKPLCFSQVACHLPDSICFISL